MGPVAGRWEMGPNQNNFPSLENEPKDEGFAGDRSKMVPSCSASQEVK